MEMQTHLNALESLQRLTLTALLSAKARYLSLLEDSRATPHARQEARRRFEELTIRKHELDARVGEDSGR